MQNRFVQMVILLLSLGSCSGPGSPGDTAAGNRYARGFTITTEGRVKRLEVTNPWESARDVRFTYYLIDRNDTVPATLRGRNIIRVPARRVVCLSTSHLAFLEAIGETDKVTGISGTGYVTSPAVRNRIDAGLTTDVGYGSNLNYEEILRQEPDLVLVYGVDSEIAGHLDKFRDLSLPAVICGEYLEDTPLGKAEWIRFAASFFGKEETADSVFSTVANNYLELAHRASGVKHLPTVMVGIPYRDSWWVPGGRSYLSCLIADAGGTYASGQNRSHESFVISLEEALIRASAAEIWINTGTACEPSDILAADPRLASFPLFTKGKIYNNNLRTTPAGGNDFWEGGTVRPDLALADLIRIFHPGLLPDDTLTYYRQIR